MANKGNVRIRLWRYIQRNDVVLHIFTSFAFVLALTGGLIGCIFVSLYQKNYVNSYTKLLTRQAKIISKRVANFENKQKETLFQKYSVYIDEMERAENTDVWIVAKESAKEPLEAGFVNADADRDNLSKETYEVLKKAYSGKIASNSSFDNTYGMTTLSVAVPIQHIKSKEICGAVLMVSMIDRQTMGISEGKYLITLSVLAAILISYIVAIFFSKYLSRPLEKIGKRVGSLAKGDYSKIQVKKPYSQIGILEHSLDRLATKLRRAEREREDLEQARRDFFANVSHELRTPITVISGYAETLADGMIQEQEQAETLYRRMLQECREMDRLVGDLFTLSKMQNPDFVIDMEPVSLVQIFRDVIRRGRVIGKERNITIVFETPEEDTCMIMGDYGRLRQMFMIIVDNAIKFSRENGRVEIRILKEDEMYHVSIRDYGIGISEEQQRYIFEKFYTSKMRQNEKGTGLGLMIAKQIALRHNSDIEVDSVLQEGTTFSFSFQECTCFDGFE